MQESEKEIRSENPVTKEGSSLPNSTELDWGAAEDISPVLEEPEFSDEIAVDKELEELPDQVMEGNTADVVADTPETAPNLSGTVGGFVVSKTVMLALAIGLPICLVAAIAFGVWIGIKNQDPWRIESGLVDYGGLSSEAESTDQIVIPGYGEILLEADTRDVMLILPNPAGNPCYFRFSILLKEGNEKIYTSGLVPPGKAIEELRLSRALEAGNYPAIIQIETFSLDETRTPMNGANVETVLNLR